MLLGAVVTSLQTPIDIASSGGRVQLAALIALAYAAAAVYLSVLTFQFLDGAAEVVRSRLLSPLSSALFAAHVESILEETGATPPEDLTNPAVRKRIAERIDESCACLWRLRRQSLTGDGEMDRAQAAYCESGAKALRQAKGLLATPSRAKLEQFNEVLRKARAAAAAGDWSLLPQPTPGTTEFHERVRSALVGPSVLLAVHMICSYWITPALSPWDRASAGLLIVMGIAFAQAKFGTITNAGLPGGIAEWSKVIGDKEAPSDKRSTDSRA